METFLYGRTDSLREALTEGVEPDTVFLAGGTELLTTAKPEGVSAQYGPVCKGSDLGIGKIDFKTDTIGWAQSEKEANPFSIASTKSQVDQILRAQGMTQGTVQERVQALGRRPDQRYPSTDACRTQLLSDHMQTFGALGAAAGQVNDQLAASGGDRAALAQAEARLREISDGARALFEAARADDFPEIAREADVLKQRMAALQKRLGRPPERLQ